MKQNDNSILRENLNKTKKLSIIDVFLNNKNTLSNMSPKQNNRENSIKSMKKFNAPTP